MSISYKIQAQGIGFNAWLKNVKTLKEVEEERKKIRKQAEIKNSKNKEKVQEKKNRFNSKFDRGGGQGDDQGSANGSNKTKEYNLKGIEDILNILDD